MFYTKLTLSENSKVCLLYTSDKDLAKNAIRMNEAVREESMAKLKRITGLENPNSVLQLKAVSYTHLDVYKRQDAKGTLFPYAEKNDGLFEIKECFNEKTDWKGYQTLITPKGRETFRLLLEGGVS